MKAVYSAVTKSRQPPMSPGQSTVTSKRGWSASIPDGPPTLRYFAST